MKVALRMNRASLFLNNNVAKSLSNLFSYPKNKNEDPFELDFALGLSGGNQIEQNSILDYEKRYLNKIPNELNASYTKIPILINMLILFGILAMVILRCGLLQRTELHKTSNRKIFKTSLSVSFTSIFINDNAFSYILTFFAYFLVYVKLLCNCIRYSRYAFWSI